MLCAKIVIFCFDIQNNVCTQHVLNWDSMNNLLSYCGLADSKMRASDTDLPVKVFSEINKPVGPISCVGRYFSKI